jgi:hypothetical protein
MGFLDHSTNNIIVDAVLTDVGRKALSRNDGSFSIFEFALADDEVDYEIITKFGRTIGKEKIEKNTPVLEACTQGSLGVKYPLMSANNEFLFYLPKVSFVSGADDDLIEFTRGSNTITKEIKLEAVTLDNNGIDDRILDTIFYVELNSLFLKIQSKTPDIIYTDNIAAYSCESTSDNAGKARIATLTIEMKSFSDSISTSYQADGSGYISTFIKFTGNNSGISKLLEAKITIPS